MKINLRWQALLAVVGFGLVAALLSFQIQTESLCTTRVPAPGGTFAEGIVGAPQFINPLLSDAYPVDRELVSLVFDGLTRYDETGRLVPHLAQSWTVSEDDLTLQFQLRQDITWHDGEPFTAADVLFTYRLLQDELFPGPPALKTLWQSAVVSQTGPHSLQITLPEPYAPFLDATTRGILPAHLLGGITAVSLPTSAFNRAPIGTGPFMVNPGQNWNRDHRLRLTPNPNYWREGTQIANLEFRFYPSEEALLAAFAADNIQAVNRVSQTMLPNIAAQPGTRLFTAAEPYFAALLFNLTESGAPALQDDSVRRALAYALDRERLVDETLNGQGLPLEGPYLPSSWAYNPALLTAYASQPITATALLDAAGWGLPEGSAVRQKEDAPFNLRLLTLGDATHEASANGVADQWANVGVNVEILTAVSVEELVNGLTAREFDVALVDVAAVGDPDLYDFWSQEAIVRGQNYGGWNNRRASEALENGRKLWPLADRQPFYDAFLRHYNNDLPAITLYQRVYAYALNDAVNEAEIGQITHPRDRYQTFANWFILFRDITVSCPN
ncbi:MAG: peptide ABC transporter substrate-binding protein [Chloroflexi bacterium]|nr:peptide ABC transporter substrate-binding protein [Chloroflexota bacterium]